MAAILTESPSALEKLRLLVESEAALRSKGYITRPLDAEEIEAKKRCEKCGSRIKRWKRDPKPPSTEPGPSRTNKERITEADEEMAKPKDSALDKKAARPVKPICSFHTGRVWDKVQNRPIHTPSLSPPFSEPPYHITLPKSEAYIVCTNVAIFPLQSARFKTGLRLPRQTYPHGLCPRRTRERMGLPPNPFRSHPKPAKSSTSIGIKKQRERTSRQREGFNSESRDGSAHFNTRYSGVSAADMRRAVQEKNVIWGRDEARRMIWRYVGRETVVVVHGGNGDFAALRWIHGEVVDTYLAERFVAHDEQQNKQPPIGNAATRNSNNITLHEIQTTVPTSNSVPVDVVKSHSISNNQANTSLFVPPKTSNPSQPKTTDPTASPASNPSSAKPQDEPKPPPNKPNPKPEGGKSLKYLAQSRLGRTIQAGGKRGHCSEEDARACRDLAWWHCCRIPG
ncbi:hypothetical protein MMC25_004619 [Agyrium rufum]|nr:hypothetical protein [Agyrium rufum]